MVYVPGTSGNDAGLTALYGYDNSSDLIYGFAGHDDLYGLSGNDFLNGGAGNDYMYGGSGNDTYEIGGSGSGGAGGLTGGWDKFIEYDDEGDDRILILPTAGWAWTAIQISGFGPTPGIDEIEIIENNTTGPGYVYVRGTVDFEDVTQWINMNEIRGTANADTIKGSNVDDPDIYGNGGNDIIDGRAGENDLYGGAGKDTFVVSTDGDHSTIHDFDIDADEEIQFTSDIADDISDLSISDVSGDALITVGTVAITVAGVDHNLLTSGDYFAFV